jgi:hypothetical protein
MKTSEYYATNCFFGISTRDGAKSLIEIIQTDALQWAAEQIITDGNPDVARDKIMRKIDDVAAMPNEKS